MPPGLTYPSLKCVFEFLEANKRLLESLFVGRRVIIVQKLVTGRLLPLSRKLELKFNVLEMESDGYHLKDFVPLIEPTSFPLKKLTQKPFSPIFFEQPEVRTANHLVINNFYNSFDSINILKSLNCKYVEIKDLLFNENYVLDTIQMLLENHRDVETCYMIDTGKYTSEYTRNLIERIKERFNGTYVNFMDADKRSTLTSHYFSIPINSRTELAVYRNESLKERQEIVIMEVILTGNSPKIFRLDQSKSYESFEKKYSDDDRNNRTEDDRSPNRESNQSPLGKSAFEKFKMPIISLPITTILIVALFAWFFFF
ncbi:hypothetical protein GCK72_007249 [Caenorhabditis remanei]|uniref:DUF38 domain-containing protein n=1 Tax=Caenorhabditis remanei TaxID=31234 RepID=A0A6A5HGW2_CAERE|nr:hypothetical protein GCK72_007249 [Caenorhabditis remanei]KAF1767290.1 hypothetical protein GCK72_007249 [Caenorhabditis remanei]